MTELVADLQAQLVKLNAARANGVRQIQYSANGVSRLVEYRSDAEMAMAQNDLMRRISILLGNVSRTVKISSSKGLGDHNDERF
jgi:hypothetical protein